MITNVNRFSKFVYYFPTIGICGITKIINDWFVQRLALKWQRITPVGLEEKIAADNREFYVY